MAHGLRNGGGLRGGRLRSKEDTDPMASVANIADIMLVFACGLMMALVTVWNIDFTPLSELQDKQLEAIDMPEDMPEDMSDAGNAYVEKGMVYQDPKTGKYYMVTEDKDAMDSDLASQGTSSGDSTSSSSASSSSSSGSKSRAASPSGSTSASGSSSSAAAPDRSAGAD
ncbi:hypothetical protein [Ellagibacter sp.]|uniref:hypothetical protein n=1 Tax=Ellagibacter sp. TaxID=2137578 RepID=UPI003AB51A2A